MIQLTEKEYNELKEDAELLRFLQADLDKHSSQVVFSVYEGGTRVFALRNALRARMRMEEANGDRQTA